MSPPGRAWNVGSATGLGALPGLSADEAARSVAGELPQLPHLAQLPERGVGADPIGRAVGMLVEIWGDVVPSGWRISRRPSRDSRRAGDFLAWDLDAAEQHLAGAAQVKVQICGPWTLAAGLEVPSGNRAVTDAGAVTDLAESLREGVLQHLADVRRRLPGAEVIVQLDEPALPAVMAGTLSTASGFGTVRAVPEQRVRDVLADLVHALGDTAVIGWCPGASAPLSLLRGCGIGALAVDVTELGSSAARLDPIGEAVEAGVVLLAGLVPPTAPRGDRSLAQWARPLLETWSRLGLPRGSLAGVVPTPTSGLEAATPEWAVTAMATCRRLAEALADPPEGW